MFQKAASEKLLRTGGKRDWVQSSLSCMQLLTALSSGLLEQWSGRGLLCSDTLRVTLKGNLKRPLYFQSSAMSTGHYTDKTTSWPNILLFHQLLTQLHKHTIVSHKHTLSQQFGYRLQLAGKVKSMLCFFFSPHRTNLGFTEGFWLENICVPEACFRHWLNLSRGCLCKDLSASVSPSFL